MKKNKTYAPQTWRNAETHYIKIFNNRWYKDIVLLENQIVQSTFSFFREEGALSVCLPITSTACTSPMGLGSDSLPVIVNLANVRTYLADSMQFHLEYIMRIINKNVHYLMPSFRGEMADERHLCQFYHSEAEIHGSLDDVIDLVNRYVTRLCVDLLDNLTDVIEEVAGTTEHIEKIIQYNGNIPQIMYKDALEELKGDSRYIKETEYGFMQITSSGEKKLIANHGGIVWLTHHDYLSVPFYQAKEYTGKYALNADLLFGIGEVVGAGERCVTGTEVSDSLKKHNVLDNYDWYINMKNIAPLKTSGFGMGIERFLLFIMNHTDIRDIPIILRFNGMDIYP